MIKLKTIADLLDYETDDLTTEFDDSKDIFFKTMWNECIEILKIDHAKSIIFVYSGLSSDLELSIELKNNKLDGRRIYWSEWIDYSEFEDGALHGYSEYAFQEILSERGFYKNGLKDGWWEFGSKYHDILFYENREDFHSLENYRPAFFKFYIKDILINHFHTLDSEYEYQGAIEEELKGKLQNSRPIEFFKNFDAIKGSFQSGQDEIIAKAMGMSTEEYKQAREDILKDMKDAVESGKTYSGIYTDSNYISYENYLKITNLPKFKSPSEEISDAMYSHCATSIDFDQIQKEYDMLRIKKKVYRESFISESVRLWPG